MSDLKTRFRGTERIPTPDLWPDISNREPRPLRPGPSPARRVLVAAFALALALAGLAFVARTFEGRESPQGNVSAAPTNGVIAYRDIGTAEGVFRTVSPDGSDPREIHVEVPGFVGVPSWSPSGTRIAFDVNSFDEPHPESGWFDIYTANADGSDPTRLTFDKNDHSPVWSPGGTEIAYVLGIGNVQQIVVMSADGSDPRQLTDGEGLHIAPSWSPDGTKIAFVSWDGANSDIYVMDADGSNVQRITNDPAHEDQPAWSPDGRLIAFSRIALSSGDSGDNGIFTMAPDGTDITKLFHVPDAANVGFAWSPDGKEMAIVSITSHSGRTVGVLDLATGILTPITEPGALDNGASWQPVPSAAVETPTPGSTAPPLLGAALADSLGLELQSRQPAGCQYYVEVDNPKGYCLDAVSGSKVDHWVLATELQGRVPTVAQIKCAAIADKLGNWEGATDSSEYRDLQNQFMEDCRTPLIESSSPPP
jgi:dipeptidyl aminopeptidase/acylaminoacyl peptidase